ncbi:unnamed protein product [Prorocentrum cordatum]|nr:unnamed protein product [Polarella glacialis]
MASRAGGLAAQERFLQCCRRVDAAGSGTVPSKGLAVFLQRLGLEQQEVEGLLLEADAGGGCTDYVKLAGALWVSGPEGDDEASASSELRGEACAVVPDGGVREAGDEQPVPDATLDEAVPQHSFGLPIARKEAPRGAAEGAAGEPARQTLQDGSVYEGQLSPGGERHGWGRICFGSVYEGEWMHNQMHGNGKFISPDGSVYNGQWVENCIGPSGSISWPGGPEYVGAFRDGLQHGRGKVSWPDGRSYEGEFANGKQHGRGVYSKPPSFISLSEWHEGQFVQWLEGAVSEPSGSFSAGAETP